MAELELSYCYMILGDFDSALPILKNNITHSSKDLSDQRMQSLYQLAQIYYFRSEFKTSLAWLDTLSSNKWQSLSFQHPSVNDGLRLRFFIKYYTSYCPDQLNQICRADYLIFQRNYENAIVVLDSLLQDHPSCPIQADVLFRLGEIYLLNNDKKHALKYFHSILDLFPKHFLADQALERCGYVFEKLGNPKQAVEQYEALLTNYPHSFFSEEIRNRIRSIEQESL